MNLKWLVAATLGWTLVLAGGCNQEGPRPVAPGVVRVPAPIDMMLPKEVAIHPFTGGRVFGPNGGIVGLDVRIEAKDAYGDPTKAFGAFRFELYQFKPNASDPKGDRIAVWNEDLADPVVNRRHWNFTRTYQFTLGWNEPITVGKKYVLQVYFESPFIGPRLSNERVFLAGE